MTSRDPEYLDCELFLSGYDQAKLTVAGRDYCGRPALDEELQRRLLESALDPVQYGTFLFKALFRSEGEDLLAGYREALAIARHEEKRLRFRLHVSTAAPPRLHDLQWEFLYDPKQRVALGRSRDTAFSRYMSVSLPPAPAVSEKPRLLIVISTPDDLAELKLAEIDREQMRQAVEKALSPLQDLVTYEFLDGPATAPRICDRLVGGEFHALHVLAHGLLRRDRPIASLVLEDDDGRAAFVEEELFSEIFEGERGLRLVCLIACHGGARSAADPFSGLGPALMRGGIPAVVAMQQAISVEAAGAFSEHFYRNLARSGQVDTAANEARRQLHLSDPDSIEWGTPALFMRLTDGRLWEPTAGASRPPHPKPGPIDQEVPWAALLERIGSGKFIPILGPGVCRGLLPSSEEIAERWAVDYDYPFNGHTRKRLPCVTQYMETKVDTGYPHDILSQLLADDLLEREEVQERDRLCGLDLTSVIEKIADRHFDRDQDEPHRILAELPIATYVTTNFDSFMTAALGWVNKAPQRRYCIWQQDSEDDSAMEEYKNLSGTREQPLVFHLYGNDEAPTTQVLTEDDHLDFLRMIAADFEHRIPLKLHASLTNSMLLFLGYNVRELDCRVLFRGLVKQLKNLRRGRLAVLQLQPEEYDSERSREVKRFMKKCCDDLHIRVYWGSVREFLVELRERWRAKDASP